MPQAVPNRKCPLAGEVRFHFRSLTPAFQFGGILKQPPDAPRLVSAKCSSIKITMGTRLEKAYRLLKRTKRCSLPDEKTPISDFSPQLRERFPSGPGPVRKRHCRQVGNRCRDRYCRR